MISYILFQLQLLTQQLLHIFILDQQLLHIILENLKIYTNILTFS